MSAWLVVLAAGLGSYFLRMSMVVAAGWVRLPGWFDNAAALIAPSAFSVLAVLSVAEASAGAGAHAVAPLAAVAIGIIAVQRTGWAYAAVLAGMPTFWFVAALVPA